MSTTKTLLDRIDELLEVFARKDKRRPVFFHQSLAASSKVVLVSERITYPARVKNIVLWFPRNQQRYLQLKLLYAMDESSDTNAPMVSGRDLIPYQGNLDYFCGDDLYLQIPCDVELPKDCCLKVSAYNTDPADPKTIFVFMFIEPDITRPY